VLWDIEVTKEFEAWWDERTDAERRSLTTIIDVLEAQGPSLGRPYADKVRSSDYPTMKELRIQHAGEPYRILFSFDPRSTAILLIGGNKTGDRRWYERFVPIADRLFKNHLQGLKG
jgi:hypothetical protein